MQSIRFIINPISGVGKQRLVEAIVEQHLSSSLYSWSFAYTQHRGHGVELASNAVKEGVDIVVAVGGDGSINEIGSALVGSETILGIIPTGSGNGFARHFEIPLKLKEAIENLNAQNIQLVDTGVFNGKVFLGVAGLGFDAHIGKAFDKAPTRGLGTYIWVCLKTFFQFSPKWYTIIIDGVEHKMKAFILTVCNTNQFGNEAKICPQANAQDGELDLVVIKKMPFYQTPLFIWRLFRGEIESSPYFRYFKGRDIKIQHSDHDAHLDGEPIQIEEDVHIFLQKKSLKIIAGKDWQILC